jgi:hypothetical protein
MILKLPTSDNPAILSTDRPFPGLRPFTFADHEYFFGREDQSFELYRRLEQCRFITVVGSSGSGKSSLVRAGLHPLIVAETREVAGRKWQWVELRPGRNPLMSLSAALTSLDMDRDDPAADAGQRERFAFILRQSRYGLNQIIDLLSDRGGARLLLFVDQFEELFRFAATGRFRERDQAEAAAWREEAIQFVQLLLLTSRDPERLVHVVLTMRADFIGDCARFQGLPEAVSGGQFLVPSLTRDQRNAVIRGPLERGGGSIEPALVERLLNDAGDELDELPVLQHCLRRLWEKAGENGEQRHITSAHYDAIGGIAQALSRHADDILASLPGDDLVVEQVFRALSDIDSEGRAIPRPLSFEQLLDESGVDEWPLRRVLDRFRSDDCCFLGPLLSEVADLSRESTIDVGHEIILRRWDRISGNFTMNAEDDRIGHGWLREEEHDGQIYHALLALSEGGRTLPFDQVESRWAWWISRPRTVAWTQRYGGHIDRINQLFEFSRAAIERERSEAAERTKRDQIAARIIIRHLRGSKINQVEQFPGDLFPEFIIGRDLTATIQFNATLDDTVSRRHAIIRTAHKDRPHFMLADLGSSNGTFLNGQRIGGETELLPGNIVELGASGPRFNFDLEPRNAGPHTRALSPLHEGAESFTHDHDHHTQVETQSTPIQSSAVDQQPQIGRNTVMRLFFEERRDTARAGIYVLAGILAVIGIVTGSVYYADRRAASGLMTTLQDLKNELAVQKARIGELSVEIFKQQHNTYPQ